VAASLLYHYTDKRQLVVFCDLHYCELVDGWQSFNAETVVVGHGPQSVMGLSIDSSSVAMNLRTVRISKSKKKMQLQKLEITKMEVSPILVV